METQIDTTKENNRAEIKPKRSKPDKRWTLLFIGDHGKVLTLKRFKSLTFFAGFIFLLSLATIVLLYWYNQSINKNNEKLQSSLDILQKRIKTLRHEKDILMARLVLAESRVKESLGDISEKPARKSLQVDQQSISSLEHKTLKSEIKQKESTTPPPVEPKVAAIPPKSNLSVNVEDFSVQQGVDHNNLKIQFKVKNTTPDSQRVSGHAIVVLKSDDLQPKMWLPVPPLALVDGKPTGKQRGHAFAINYFRTMRFTTNLPRSPEQYDKAAVYVFTGNGELLLEKDFPVEIDIQNTEIYRPSSTDSELRQFKSTGTQEIREDEDSQNQTSEAKDVDPLY